MTTRTVLLATIVAVAAGALPGCVGFSGPSDVARRIETSRPVDLDKEFGISVGPLGVFLASAIASPWLPVDINGVSSVDFGEYTVEAISEDPRATCLRDLELAGWEPFLRVCEDGSDVVAMVNENGRSVTGLLVVTREGGELQIVRVRGDFDKIIDNLMSSELLKGSMDGWLDFDGAGVECEDEAEAANAVQAAGLRQLATVDWSESSQRER